MNKHKINLIGLKICGIYEPKCELWKCILYGMQILITKINYSVVDVKNKMDSELREYREQRKEMQNFPQNNINNK